LQYSALGAGGMFAALVVGVIVALVMALFKSFSFFKKDSSMPDFVRFWFDAMVPVIVLMGAGWLLVYVLNFDIFGLLQAIFQPIAQITETFPGFVIGYFLWCFLYSMGISTWLPYAVYTPIFLSAIQANADAVAAGGIATNISTMEVWFSGWLGFGGTGATLTLVILLSFSKVRQLRTLGRASIFPGILNINEPIIFGLPIVLNPYYFIPFLAAPIASAVIAFAAMNMGIVPFPTQAVAWTTPIFVSGYLSTGSGSAVTLQLVCLLVSVLIYMPFVSLARQTAESRYREDFHAMERQMSYLQFLQTPKVMTRSDEAGGVARYLAREISDAIQGDAQDGGLHIEYQPKSAADGRVLGAEALLRWAHPVFGWISPPTVLGLADEAGLSNRLGRWIIRQSLLGMARWRAAGLGDLSLSINLSPTQLNTDEGLGDFIGGALAELSIPPGAVEFELTENATIERTERLERTLKTLRDRGSDISIDDFGMGHSSLKYIFDFCANVVKLDTSLVQGLTEGEDRRIIVRAILDLCKSLGVRVIAEGVETEQQLAIAAELGAEAFQGWYFSKAMKYNDFLEYVDSHREGEKP